VRTPLTIYGIEGAIAVTGPSELTIATRATGGGTSEPRVVPCPPLPDHARSGPSYFVHQLLTGQPFEGIVSAEVSRDAQEILQAGLLSIAEGREVSLPLRAFLD